MPLATDAPLLVLTSDVDWASDACIEDFAEAILPFGIRPVFMATGESAALRRLFAAGLIELGLHPNFLPGSDHGADVPAVIEHLTSMYPDATTFRAHSFVDSSQITSQMHARGFAYDSNLCLYLQDGLVPLQHGSGLIRFPVFWEDDLHWTRGGSWDFDTLIDQFMTPGLKVLNVHPINFALNVTNTDHYQSVRSQAKTLTSGEIKEKRYAGTGTRTFTLRLIERLHSAGLRFWTLGELYECVAPGAPRESSVDRGRATAVSQSEFEAYWQAGPGSRQQKLREIFDRRNPFDRYATSRDFQLRELEILGIKKYLPQGDILDLGCGNGYTLISLSKEQDAGRMVGVDFSGKLIGGAVELAMREAVTRPPKFICADAVEYIAKQAAETLDGVVTERFLLNLPDAATQRYVISQIYRLLRPAGRFLMCEASMQGFEELNRIRREMGLAEIAEKSGDNLSAIRFEDCDIERFTVEDVGFRMLAKLGFSDYFTISRVLHPLLVAPREPRFDARINELARRLQSVTALRAGVGSNTLWVFEKR
jgi:SAM-dependent methyltransferase